MDKALNVFRKNHHALGVANTNNFLSEKDFNDEYFFEMEPAFCNTCKTFQLIRQPEPQQMFNENYAFFSGTSKFMSKHFEAFSNKVLNYLDEDPFVVEIGSNDGIMLSNFANRNIKHLGVEPSSNVAMVAKEKGINTTINFFDEDLAQKIELLLNDDLTRKKMGSAGRRHAENNFSIEKINQDQINIYNKSFNEKSF